jgi:hypothetical protein
MRRMMLALAAAGLLAACSAEPAPKAEETETASALKPGEYEIGIKIDSLRSTDKTTPAVKGKVGDPPTSRRTCVAADGAIAAEAFADPGDKCTETNSYVRGGRLSVQLSCTRPNGQLMQLAVGDFKADSFEAKLTTATYFKGSGDYEMTRTLSGKRVGECPAASAETETGKAKG